jgi:outer membrane protein assembly factor BamB
MFKIIIAVFGAAMVFACHKPDSIKNNEPLKLLWSTRLTTAGSYGSIMTPVIADDNVLYSTGTRDLGNDDIVILDKKDGKKVNTCEEFRPEYLFYAGSRHYFDHHFVFATGQSTYCMTVPDGKIIWNDKTEKYKEYEKHITGIGSTVMCRAYTDTIYKYNQTFKLRRGNIYSKNWKDIFTLTGEGDYDPTSIRDPVYYITPDKDTLAIFNTIKVDFAKHLTLSDIIAYSFRGDSIKYIKRVNDPIGVGLHQIVNDRVLMLVGEGIEGFNPVTGDSLWKTYLFSTNHLVVTDKEAFVLGTNNGDIAQINPITGAKETYQIEGAENPGRGVFFENKLYFVAIGNSTLYCIDTNTHQVLWKIKSPLEKDDYYDFLTPGIAIDPVTRRLYAASYTTALCYQLP